MKINLVNCEKQLSENDIKKVEQELSIELPKAIKEHYLKFNGGKPISDAVWENSSAQPSLIEFREFIPMIYCKQFRNKQDYTMNGRTLEEWNLGELPRNLVQFAMDDWSNYICIDYADGKIYYFNRDFDNTMSREDNLKANATLISDSFTEFINALVIKNEAETSTEDVKTITRKKTDNKKLSIKSLVKKIEKYIAENADDEVLDYLATYKKVKGATEKDLKDFENQFDVLLPDEFKELYKYKNGSKYPFNMFYSTYNESIVTPFYMMSLDEIRQTKAAFCDKSKLMSEFDGFFSKEGIENLDNRIKPYLFNKRWIPFARLVGGSLYLMLDFDPTVNGSDGQVIVYVHDPDYIHYVCKDIRELLNDTLQNLEEENYDEF